MKYIFIVSCLLMTGCQAVTWNSLYGLPKASVEARMGKPVSIMRENTREIWTYRQEKCTTHVFFDANGNVKYIDMNGVCSK